MDIADAPPAQPRATVDVSPTLDFASELHTALKTLESDRAFAHSESYDNFPDPVFRADGQLILRSPVLPEDVEVLKRFCQQASNGYGAAGRKIWTLANHQLESLNPHWHKFVSKRVLEGAVKAVGL